MLNHIKLWTPPPNLKAFIFSPKGSCGKVVCLKRHPSLTLKLLQSFTSSLHCFLSGQSNALKNLSTAMLLCFLRVFVKLSASVSSFNDCVHSSMETMHNKYLAMCHSQSCHRPLEGYYLPSASRASKVMSDTCSLFKFNNEFSLQGWLKFELEKWIKCLWGLLRVIIV